MTRQFKALLTAAKLPNIRLHDLRHSCATLKAMPVSSLFNLKPRPPLHLPGEDSFESSWPPMAFPPDTDAVRACQGNQVDASAVAIVGLNAFGA